jgi:hypothetical protein
MALLKTLVLTLLALGFVVRLVAFLSPNWLRKGFVPWLEGLFKASRLGSAAVVFLLSLMLFYLVFSQAPVVVVVGSAMAGLSLLGSGMINHGFYKPVYDMLKKWSDASIRWHAGVSVVVLAVLIWLVWNSPFG